MSTEEAEAPEWEAYELDHEIDRLNAVLCSPIEMATERVISERLRQLYDMRARMRYERAVAEDEKKKGEWNVAQNRRLAVMAQQRTRDRKLRSAMVARHSHPRFPQ